MVLAKCPWLSSASLSIQVFHHARRSSFKGFGFEFVIAKLEAKETVDLLLRLQTSLSGIVDSCSLVQSLKADSDSRS